MNEEKLPLFCKNKKKHPLVRHSIHVNFPKRGFNKVEKDGKIYNWFSRNKKKIYISMFLSNYEFEKDVSIKKVVKKVYRDFIQEFLCVIVRMKRKNGDPLCNYDYHGVECPVKKILKKGLVFL